MLKGKKIVLGVTGSIAAYKSAVLLRLLVKKGAEVQVLMTKAGKEFITPVTLSALSGKPVLGEFFERGDGTWHSHVDLGLWADAMLIAPATASTMGKMVNGICDNLLVTTYLSARCPVFVAPAMDLDMFQHPSTLQNMTTLQSWGCTIIEPASGALASGLEGKGRMEEPEAIVQLLEDWFVGAEKKKPLSAKRILLTAGPTYEAIDPVRFIGNYSSGKMGFALAEELAARGARVELVCGPVHLKTVHPNIHRSSVTTAAEMLAACQELFPLCDGAIMAAAVADYRVAQPAAQKIKRSGEALSLQLVPNPDIARELGLQKRPGQVVAGFALETVNEEQNARLKLEKKNLDFIVLNSLAEEGAGFMGDTNKISIIGADNKRRDFPLKTKAEVASDIVDHLEACLITN
ncbi:bifunctional phosphopantothenoylcysteine decarboxylase/phosphopantothenate--cysteine ligase CoaBC [Geofilum rhodophaeum]|uniref:bifunctional phosphopantothenoylcysteine decarboxylase/phosphopantothenate--cysteine ligase CoaBC n=1 Tax=Geofilum rhodophaeum TaxID=1965019 RepID=UPI000B5267F3|nr:bifunctional phosphopantothenoylcysteine decarboxylase/phosphopantothenate--cysteine ligase CoaBC [Geofilum rhodophaeum]